MTHTFKQRQAGVLLHPSSLPGKGPKGYFGKEAYSFVDFLQNAGLAVWQVLPFGPTGADGSPYQSNSCFAISPDFLDLDFVHSELLPNWTSNSAEAQATNRVSTTDDLLIVFEHFAAPEHKQRYESFKSQNAHWLHDYVLYCTIKQVHAGQSWVDWPEALKHRHEQSLDSFRETHARELETLRFEQYVLHESWLDIKNYANTRRVSTFGDLPIFTSHDSADVWSHPELFTLDSEGHCKTVAGVPPDYFSETGQRWGNPHYHWDKMEQNDFWWWRQRLERQLTLFDWVRIDHFRGFEAYWVIDSNEQTAINGHWEKGPGSKLFEAFRQHFGELPIVAEDLGIITDEVTALRQKYKLPGMKILQFAFGGDASNPYLPHQHERNCIVYTGTHDNNTTAGWFASLDEGAKRHCFDYLGYPDSVRHGISSEDMCWILIRTALSSVSQTAIVPLQDLLGLGASDRMNTPGTTEGNWSWRYQPEELSEQLAQKIRKQCQLYGRLPIR